MRIRSSSLPGFGDCSLRESAKVWPGEFRRRGLNIREILPPAGAAVGTAVHHGVAEVLRDRDCPRSQAIERGVNEFEKEAADGVEWDARTRHSEGAKKQISRMIRAKLDWADKHLAFNPILIEESVAAVIEEGYELTGHIDYLERETGITDWKTGVLDRNYIAQLGSYSLLARSNKLDVDQVRTVFTKRTPASKIQDLSEEYLFERNVAENAAYISIKHIVRMAKDFENEEEATRVFPANPMSMMCTEKYCPLWGTNSCNVWRKK